MATGTGGNCDEAIGAFTNGTFGKAVVNYVVEDDATPVMNLIVHPLFSAERSDDDGHFVFLAHVHVML